MASLLRRTGGLPSFTRPSPDRGSVLRTILTLFVIFALAILQTSATPYFPIFGIRPDLPLIFIAVWATVARSSRVLLWAFALGFLLDVVSGTPTGTNMLAITFAAYVATLGGAGMFRTNLPWSLAAVATGTLVFYPTSMVILAVQGFAIPWLSALTNTLALAIIVNLGATLVLYWPISLLERLTRGRRPYRIP
jgi:rod shape-determining protein MreD